MQANFKSDMRSIFNTDERTYERDEDATSRRDESTGCNARARTTDGPALIGELLVPGDLWPTERHPVIRSGERDEIPVHVRVAVWLRDRGKCELCNARTPADQPWHLDHITPWSAGGSDDTTNLRVLCERHNLERSNRIDPTERPRRAATWWCLNCYANEGWPWRYVDGAPECQVHHVGVSHHNPWRCPVVRGYKSAFARAGVLPTWHRIEPLNSGSTVAYCAHCNAPGLTSVTL